MITLESGTFGWDYVIACDDGREVLVQSDWDYPGTAGTFGWTGTEDDYASTSDWLAAAQEYLDDNIGASVEDPGYFDVD